MYTQFFVNSLAYDTLPTRENTGPTFGAIDYVSTFDNNVKYQDENKVLAVN